MNYTILYSEYMEYEAKKKFEEQVQAGQIEPTAARVTEYKVEPVV